jgi:hypothetical protein
MFEGNGDAAMGARMRVTRTAGASYGVAHTSSNTLQSRAGGHSEALRASLIEATVQAIAAGSDPRLADSRARL